MKLTKETLNTGAYLTYLLTNEKGEIYGMNDREYINFDCPINSNHTFYWSECYVEPAYRARIINKGMRLINPTCEQLTEYFNQSKVNFDI